LVLSQLIIKYKIMSNKQNDIYNETREEYDEEIEQQGHCEEKTPFEVVMEADDFIFDRIKNL